MKILAVRFKNINSLTGEWEICFDRSPISDTGLFAIVGPNGSGKSSILDAITLGLYGETPRLRSPETAVLNLNGKASYAEVTFSVKDHCYCSRWSLPDSGKNPQHPEMTLFSLNGKKTLLESRSVPVRNRIAELTGLDFKRFCRSILLAQGQFSAFLNALENERAEILEKIIGPEMIQEMEASIRSRAEKEAEQLHRLKEEAAGFQAMDSARADEIRQSMEQAREDIQKIDRDLETLRDLETWLERVAKNPTAEQDAAAAAAMAETRHAEVRKKFQELELARPAGLYRESLAQLEALKARADAIQGESLQLEAQVPARENQTRVLEERLKEIGGELEAARERLAARTAGFTEAAQMDRDIAVTAEWFMKSVTRLEAIAREQRDALRLQSELEEKEKGLEVRTRELVEWIGAHVGEESLVAEMPAMESFLTQLVSIRQEMEKCSRIKADVYKAEGRAAKVLQRAAASAQKARLKADRLKDRKAGRDGLLLAVYAGETKDSLKEGIDQGLKKLAACRALVRIGRKSAAFRNIADEIAENRSRREALEQSISMEQSRLLALEGQIRRRDTIRRFEPDRGALQPGEPCPLCGASAHPFLEQGVIDFTELDRIVVEREEKIRVQQAALASLQSKDQVLQKRASALEQLRQGWAEQCAVAVETWDFGNTNPPLELIRAVRKEIRTARSRMRSAWWYAWRAKGTDSALARMLEKLSKREKTQAQAQDQYELRHTARVRIDSDLSRLGQTEEQIRSAFSARLHLWLEPLPDPGAESLPVERLKERSELYRRKRRERMAAADELQRIQAERHTLSQLLLRLQEESRQLSADSQTIQTRLNALKADRQARYGDLDPGAERQTLENQVAGLRVEEQALIAETDALRQGLAADRQALQRLRDHALQIRSTADAAEHSLLEKSGPAGFAALDDIREGLSVLDGEQEILCQLAEAEKALTAVREALATLRPEFTTPDSLDTVRWKISDAVKRQKELGRNIDGWEHALEQKRQAERAYRELLNAVSVQEKAYAEAAEAQRGVEGGTDSGEKLQQLLLKQLLEETNRHLSGLGSGRYILKPAGENALGLHIEDTLQSGMLRSVKTLSGGESFLVSLCLALGLSDMAGGHRKIESLFLDEGFGFLDDEMLYKVMSALKGLRANGKTVGIVSHVKRLAEEIPTQIRLEKAPGGSSRMTVVA